MANPNVPFHHHAHNTFLPPLHTSYSQAIAHRRVPPDGVASPHTPYRPRVRVVDRYKVIGFISSGTYGRVYKALDRRGGPGEFAIKKFKPDKEGEVTYTGISQSAIREMSLCSELSHPNVIRLVEIILEDKCIYMVFEYAEHDLLQIIHHHTTQPRAPIPPSVIRSIMFQLINGCAYLHANWVLHRDLKPANIMVTSAGEVKIGDLGLARQFSKPVHSLFTGDKVVVTIWYRAPELIMGSHHYTPAVDMWAIGCILAELMSLRPIFKGEEAKMDNKKTVPFQRNQMQRIVDVLGMPTPDRWPLLLTMPEYGQLGSLQNPAAAQAHQQHQHQHQHQNHHPHNPHNPQNPHHLHSQHHGHSRGHRASAAAPQPPPPPPQPPPPSSSSSSSSSSSLQPPSQSPTFGLERWYYSTISQGACITAATFPPPAALHAMPLAPLGHQCFDLLQRLLDYDPDQRLSAEQALKHPFFDSPEMPFSNCFAGLKVEYPHRRVSQEDNDIRSGSLPGTKRSGVPDDTLARPAKRIREV